MRGISSLIDTDVEDTAHFVDENMILSSASETEQTKKKGARTKNSDNPVKRPRIAPRKPKAIKEDVARKAAAKAPAAKRKALGQQVGDAAQPATKKISSVTVAQSEDEMDGRVGAEEPEGEAIGKPKRKVKAKKNIKVAGDGLEHSTSFEQQDQMQIEVENQKNTKKAIANPPHQMLRDSNAEANVTCSPGRPTMKYVRGMSGPRQESINRRAGNASDSERGGGDPNLRRKLGDITRKFENVDLKYRTLKDVGIIEANANMEKLRQHCESTISASNEVIASLKKELAMQMPLAQEARQLQIDLRSSNEETAKYSSKVSELESSLTVAQNEIKALQAKLAAARSSAASAENANVKTPGSAMKNSVHSRTVMVGSAEVAQAAQAAQLKEDLYSDLTGLIIRGVKRSEEGDAYDCIQTGRNGTLHFKLIVELEGDGRTTSFEETEFLYTPLLDANRDKDMIRLLPYYLKEDITFNRHHAAKFYGRVVDALMRKVEEEEEEEEEISG